MLIAAVTVQALGGLCIKGLYRDNTWVSSIFRGTDVVTLVMVVPILMGSLTLARRGSPRARLILMGMLDP